MQETLCSLLRQEMLKAAALVMRKAVRGGGNGHMIFLEISETMKFGSFIFYLSKDPF